MVASLKLYAPSQLASLSPPVEWIWDGVLATGMVTMVSSRWKQGKTTLISALLGQLGRGGTFAGSPLKPTRVAMLSEEGSGLWDKRHQMIGFHEGNIRFAPRPFRRRPSRSEWSDSILELAEAGFGAVVIDPLSKFLPGEIENRPTAITDALEDLHVLTDVGVGVLLTVHPSKGSHRGEFDARGTGAIAAFADILVNFEKPHNFVDGDRIRKLTIESRLDDSNVRLLELSADRCDYAVVSEEAPADNFSTGWPVLKAMLEDSDRAMTRKMLLEQWLEDFDKPSKSTLNRWLGRGVLEGLIVRTGSGRYHDAFRYTMAAEPKPAIPPKPTDREALAAASQVLKAFHANLRE